MDRKSLIEILEETFDVESLDENTVLSELEEWDSMAALALYTVADERFNKKFSLDELKGFKTIRDIVDYLLGS